MNSLIAKWCKYLLLNDIIKEEDISLYEFGFYQLFFYIIEYGCLTMIAIILGMFKYYLVFLFTIMIIRKNAGGIHSESHMLCFALTSIIFYGVLRVIKTYNTVYIMHLLYIPLIISVVFIIILSPVGTPNKPISDLEYKIYRKRTLLALLINIAIIFISLITDCSKIAVTVSFSVIISAILVTLGKIKMLRVAKK